MHRTHSCWYVSKNESGHFFYDYLAPLHPPFWQVSLSFFDGVNALLNPKKNNVTLSLILRIRAIIRVFLGAYRKNQLTTFFDIWASHNSNLSRTETTRDRMIKPNNLHRAVVVLHWVSFLWLLTCWFWMQVEYFSDVIPSLPLIAAPYFLIMFSVWLKQGRWIWFPWNHPNRNDPHK